MLLRRLGKSDAGRMKNTLSGWANLENPMLIFMRLSTARRNGKPRLRRM
jgi:hypothetical protein